MEWFGSCAIVSECGDPIMVPANLIGLGERKIPATE